MEGAFWNSHWGGLKFSVLCPSASRFSVVGLLDSRIRNLRCPRSALCAPPPSPCRRCLAHRAVRAFVVQSGFYSKICVQSQKACKHNTMKGGGACSVLRKLNYGATREGTNKQQVGDKAANETDTGLVQANGKVRSEPWVAKTTRRGDLTRNLPGLY